MDQVLDNLWKSKSTVRQQIVFEIRDTATLETGESGKRDECLDNIGKGEQKVERFIAVMLEESRRVESIGLAYS